MKVAASSLIVVVCAGTGVVAVCMLNALTTISSRVQKERGLLAIGSCGLARCTSSLAIEEEAGEAPSKAPLPAALWGGKAG
jgi:hypothetical protein